MEKRKRCQFRVGQKVLIINAGKVFANYERMAKIMRLKNWECRFDYCFDRHEEGEIGTIVSIRKDDYSYPLNLYLLGIECNRQSIIIQEDGVRRLTKKEHKAIVFTTIVEIVKRSERMNIGHGDRLSRLMDIEFAHDKFNLRLNDFLNADDFNFSHDFLGIQARIDRPAEKWLNDFFVPRFARG